MANENKFYLPQELFQHIQSFLNARDQAQSSVVAKSWYISCPTRPVLVFKEDDFSQPYEDVLPHVLSTTSTETLNRYKTLNLKLDKFKLKLKVRREHDFSRRNKLAGELITSALELGVSEIELKLNYYSDFSCRYDLPARDVFASTSLIRLSVDRYVIDGVIGDRVLCSRLKSLVLDKVKTTDGIVRDILARCPLIENLDFSHCVGIDMLNVSKLIKLVEFRYVDGLMARVEFLGRDRMNVTEFRCLRRLQLENVRISAEFFTRFSSMFPYIEDLTLGYFGDYDEISISSSSVRRLKLIFSLLERERLKTVQLNVPNISKFIFYAGMGDIDIMRKFKPLPSVSFENVPKDWESDMELWWRCDVDDRWFSDLREFLNQLKLSRISLCVCFIGKDVVPGEEIPCCTDIPVVEKLKVCTCCAWDWKTNDSLLLGLSRSCRAKLITECEDCE